MLFRRFGLWGYGDVDQKSWVCSLIPGDATYGNGKGEIVPGKSFLYGVPHLNSNRCWRGRPVVVKRQGRLSLV